MANLSSLGAVNDWTYGLLDVASYLDDFPEEFAQWREFMGLSLRQVAAGASVDFHAVERVEKGGNLTYANLRRLVRFVAEYEEDEP